MAKRPKPLISGYYKGTIDSVRKRRGKDELVIKFTLEDGTKLKETIRR